MGDLRVWGEIARPTGAPAQQKHFPKKTKKIEGNVVE